VSTLYQHWLIVRDHRWVATKRHAEEIHRLLVGNGLATQKPAIAEIRNGQKIPVAGAEVARLNRLPDNVMLTYPGVQGSHVRHLVGPADHDRPAAEARLESITLVLGTDFKLIENGSSLIATVVVPPRQGRRDVAPFEHYPIDVASLAFPGDPATTPPVVSVSVANPLTGAPGAAPRGYSGSWRSGLVLDCNSDVPAVAWQVPPARPNRQFVRDLAAAFDADLVEVGLFS
jgi:hypothetical protein